MTMIDFNSTPEDELAARERIREWAGEKSAISNIVNTELGVLKMILTAGQIDTIKEHIIWRMCSFLDEDESRDWIDAYHEHKDLGMDTGWVLDQVMGLCSANRKISHSNIISAVMDTMDNSKREYLAYNPKNERSDNGKSKLGSPNG